METYKYYKMKKKKYLPLYYKWMKDGMPAYGLCNSLPKDQLLVLLTPTEEDTRELWREDHTYMYWASGSQHWKIGEMTPLRQNILLLMACLNNEL